MTAPVVPDAAPVYDASAKQKSSDKVSRIPVKVVHTGETLKKPDWIRVRASSPNSRFGEIKDMLTSAKDEKYKTIVTTAGSIIVGLLGLLGYIVVHLK